MIGLGYDRMVRFMEKDDPNLRHPYDWYKYGEFGPYSWRGIVLGDPIRGRMSDECVTLIGEVRDQEEWEKIEQHEMAIDFGEKLNSMDKSQWTLVCEVVLEAGKQRLDKWSLMGRLGNKARALITQCAAWMRPDIIYVKRPVYQCRFEPQDDFFRALTPLLDPKTEGDFLFELRHQDGRVEVCTYFAGLCKIVKVNPKAFVDDVVKAYEKLSDEGKSRCLEFLLGNHPVELLHPYTKEWKAKLEEMELGCDAPDDDDDEVGIKADAGETTITDWIEDDGDDQDDKNVDGGEDRDDVVMDIEGGDDKLGIKEDDQDDKNVDGGEDRDDVVMDIEGGDDELGIKEEGSGPDDNEEYWDNEFKKALSSNEAMENLARRSVERSTELYKSQMKAMEEGKAKAKEVEEDEMRGKRPKSESTRVEVCRVWSMEEEDKKSKIPPELFLRAAVRPFTYQSLVKEIVLTRHAILDGEIGRKD
ncbi:hypothetical protein CK203_090072 [Vitis vinifera]|uniref:Uncharacterized protein n=1 Tax=Vitis vinifera TaxID=29760 RepID=A0A438E5R9_VITVI|nr:hypothetical protein CK203_090072 [Vitis vinifera]